MVSRFCPDLIGNLIGTIQAQFVLSTFLRVFHAPVTQWLEYDAYNVGVDGSIPSRRTIFLYLFRVQEITYLFGTIQAYTIYMSEHTESYIVDAAHSGNRLDLFLSEVSSHSRSHIKKLVSHGYIHIEDTVAKKAGILINEGQTIRLEQEASYEHVREEEKVDTSLYAKIVVLGETSDY